MHNFALKQLQNTRNGRIHHGLHQSHLNLWHPGCSHLPHVLTWTGMYCKLYTLRHSISAQFYTKSTPKHPQWKNWSWSTHIWSQFVWSWLFTSALCHHMDWGVLQVLHTPALNFCTILRQSNSKTSAMEEQIMVLGTSSQLIELWKNPHLCQSTQWSITAFLCLWSPQPSKQRTLQHGRACTLPPTPTRTCSL